MPRSHLVVVAQALAAQRLGRVVAEVGVRHALRRRSDQPGRVVEGALARGRHDCVRVRHHDLAAGTAAPASAPFGPGYLTGRATCSSAILRKLAILLIHPLWAKAAGASAPPRLFCTALHPARAVHATARKAPVPILGRARAGQRTWPWKEWPCSCSACMAAARRSAACSRSACSGLAPAESARPASARRQCAGVRLSATCGAVRETLNPPLPTCTATSQHYRSNRQRQVLQQVWCR